MTKSNIKKFKREYNNYIVLTEKANQAEKEYENNPENKDLEDAFDEAYKKEFKSFIYLINLLMLFTNVSFNDAKKQVETLEIAYTKF